MGKKQRPPPLPKRDYQSENQSQVSLVVEEKHVTG